MEPVIIQILAEQLAWAMWSHRAEGGYSDEAVAAVSSGLHMAVEIVREHARKEQSHG